MMGKELEEQKKNNNCADLHLLFGLKPETNKHRYNFQKCNEVAAVFATKSDGDIPDSYVVIRNKNTKKLQEVKAMDPNVEPRIYPVFYPYGTQGWHRNIPKQITKERRVTRAGYFKYRLALRNDEYNVFIHGGKLFQQWLVDSYVKIEQDKMNFFKQEKAKLRVETYKGLSDYLENKAKNINGKVGHDAASIQLCNQNNTNNKNENTINNDDSTDNNDNNDNNDDNTDKNDEKVINHNEINDYINSRYVGPSEAYWRIMSKKLKGRSHTVVRLPVHLPNQHNIILDNSDDLTNDKLESALNQVTMLHDYFDLNKRDINARNILYTNIPEHYIFKEIKINGVKAKKQWVKREKRIKAIGRMYSVSPTQSELYHLRLLLLHKKGATSYKDLLTVNDIYHNTFTDACLALGLIEDDNEWHIAMNEAVHWMMPNSLRKLFVLILIHCNPIHPERLWDTFKQSLSEDYTKKYGQTEGIKKAYLCINNILQKEGKSIHDYITIHDLDVQLTSENDDTNIQTYLSNGTKMYNMLNVCQKEIVDNIYGNISKCTHYKQT
uniref:Helitron helicase-like domain-containing protein n=1 Tax=Trichogramma kaykai TaxID=54128 RepID=A0ABD2WAL1_9HYME